MYLWRSAIVAALAMAAPLQAAITPLGQSRTVWAQVTGHTAGVPFEITDSYEATSFASMNRTVSAISPTTGHASASQNSFITPSILVVFAAASSQTINETDSYARGSARSFTQFDFSIDTPMTFSGNTSGSMTGDASDEFLLRIELFPLGSATPIFSQYRTTPGAEPPFSMVLAPGSYRVEGELWSSADPLDPSGFNAGSINFNIAPEPSTAGLLAVLAAAALARRRGG
jgi:hypothetical protein